MKDLPLSEVRLGLIGLGYIGKVHLRNCLKLDSAKVVAVSDTSEKAIRLAKRMDVEKTYSNYRELINDHAVEAVIIALPTHLHLQCVKEVAEAGKHVFLEKPLARNTTEGKEIVSHVRKKNIKLMVGYPLRFAQAFQALKKKMETGELGEVQIACATNIASGPFFHRAERGIPHPIPEWWLKKELSSGGALMDLGCHMINLLHWYFGEVTSIKTYLGYRFNLDLEDHASCMIRFKNKQIALLNVGWFSQKNHIKVDIHGTVDSASAYHGQSRVSAGIQLVLGRIPDFFKPYQRELSTFTECVRNDTAPSPSAEDALRDLETLELAYKNEMRLD